MANASDGLGDDVEVRHRDDRQVKAHHSSDFCSPLPGGVHHDLGLDRAFVRDDLVDAAILQVDLLYIGVEEDLGAAFLGAGRQRIRQACGIDYAVVRCERRAHHAFQRHGREHVVRLFGRHHFHRHTEGTRHADQPLDVFHALGRGCQTDAAHLAPGRILSRLFFKTAIQVGAVMHHARQVCIRAHLPHEPGRVPGGTTGELMALQHHDVFPPHKCHVVGNTAPTHATADDYCLRMRRKIRHFVYSP